MSQFNKILSQEKWQIAWGSRPFRRQTISGSIALITIFSLFPFFFQIIEKRSGVVLNDWLLNLLPAHDFSIPIFIIIYAVTILLVIRMIQQPVIFIIMLWAYILLCIMRVASISMVPLNAPKGLIELTDPIGNLFYGRSFVTKDLFYSGHTSSLFLIFLCFQKKTDKAFAFTATFIVGFLLLVQHVHYTIDVITAPLFAYSGYLFSKKLIYDYSY
jgi:PAP2 superfamily protein